jgi:hypothetical protein
VRTKVRRSDGSMSRSVGAVNGSVERGSSMVARLRHWLMDTVLSLLLSLSRVAILAR